MTGTHGDWSEVTGVHHCELRVRITKITRSKSDNKHGIFPSTDRLGFADLSSVIVNCYLFMLFGIVLCVHCYLLSTLADPGNHWKPG